MIQWFKRHQAFLIDESTALSNHNSYKEAFQCRDNLLISTGEIIIRANDIHKYPILILYTDATPYRLPVVFPLKEMLSREQVTELASFQLVDAYVKIKEHVEFYYALRHQNSTGELCTLERENLDTENGFYSVSEILNRVRDWFKGHVTGTYPPESEEIDFCAHFNFINEDTKIIYPESFIYNDYTEGDCYAIIYSIQPKGRYFSNNKYLYLGFHIEGVEKNGLYSCDNVYIGHHKLHDNLKNSEDLYSNPYLVNKLTEDLRLLKAHWFHIEHEPKPFHQFDELITIIGNGDIEKGINRIAFISKQTILNNPEWFYVGIRFATKNGSNDFQLFKILKSATPTPYILQPTEDLKVIALLKQYETVEAIVGEKLTPESFHQRNSTLANYTILKDKHVNLLGVGAIGSEIADCLSKAGVGCITLCDDQLVKAHNAVRHLANLESIGTPKVFAVADILLKHNPFIQIRPTIINMYNFDIGNGYLHDESISISSIADDNVEGFINQQMVIANKCVFYVRALRGGKVARIFRVIPGIDACFHCLSLYRSEGKEFIEIPEDENYPTLRNECNNPIRPASAADLKLIASLTSRIFLDNIQGRDTSANHWIWSSESIENTLIPAPYQMYSQTIPVHVNCPYCNHSKMGSVTISKDSLVLMQNLIKENPDIETGGVLAGEVDKSGNILITAVSDSGPNSIKTANRFEKDVPYCQAVFGRVIRKLE